MVPHTIRLQSLERQAQRERQPERQRLEWRLVVCGLSQLSIIFSLPPRPRVGGVLFFCLPEPATEHPTDLVERN